nr:RHS repeat-associated core domain-containing protein [Candidatus Brocadiales bacterium]
YSPAIGRWMSRDPLGEAGGINLYGFNNNNAINYIDPHGEVAIAVPVIYALAKAAIYTTSAIVGAVIGQAAWDTWFANDANTDDDGGESCDTRDKGPSGKPKVNVVDIHLERELKMLRVMRGKGTQ